MKCPVDSMVLQITNRDGIEVDYCPECRGVWLDRGELDKIIERNSGYAKQTPPIQQKSYDHDDDYEHNNHSNYGYHKKKKKNFLEDIFDF